MTTEDQYRVEYNCLLYTISEKLNANDLRKLINYCRGMISTANNINDAMALFQELENAKKLGIDRLDILKTCMKLLKKNFLLKKVEEFETRRKAYRSGILPSLRNALTEVVGVIKIVCNFGNIGRGLLVLGAGLALHCCNNRDEYIDTFNRVVLPTATKLLGTNVNSLCFIVQAETVQALKNLWKQYQDGTLQRRLQQFLKTDDFAVTIDEQEYKNALLDLSILQTRVFIKKEDDRLRERKRRNSDSVLCVKSDGNEMTFLLLKMREAEIIFQREKIESLEIEISGKSEGELQEASGLTPTENKPFEEMDEGRSADHVELKQEESESQLEMLRQKKEIVECKAKVKKHKPIAAKSGDSSRLKTPIIPFELGYQEGASEGVPVVEQGSKSKFTFVTRDLKGQKNYKEDDQVTVKIQDPTGNSLKKKIEDSLDGTYTVSFTPDTVGPHSVLLTVNGQPLTSGPWSVQVSPHQYKHVFTFQSFGNTPGLIRPYVISINKNTDHIAVAGFFSNKVQIFNADGSYLTEFPKEGNTSEMIISLAFNKNGDLIVVYHSLHEKNRISLFSESGQFIREITNKQLKKPCRISVAPDGNIILYDLGDEKVKVFSPDGVRLLQSFNAVNPVDIVYHQELFFTSLTSPGVVRVYNREGVFLYDIGGEGSGNGELIHPFGLVIDKFNNLIVCDFGKKRLQVYTLDGQFVNTIGEKVTNMHRPHSVAVSETGRLYVIDFITSCVHVFQ